MAKAKPKPPRSVKASTPKMTSAPLATSKPRADGGTGVATAIRRGMKAGIDAATTTPLSTARDPSGMESGVRTVRRVEKQGGMRRDGDAEGFLGALHGQFAGRGDELSGGFLARLCDSYNTGTLDERGLHVGLLRLLINTEGMHLLEQFRGLLPASWKATDLSWLECAVVEDCAWQAKVAGMVVGSGRVVIRPFVKVAKFTEDNDVEDKMDIDVKSDGEDVEVKQVIRKKKRPLGGYRAQSVSHIVGILEEPEPEQVAQAPTKKLPPAPKATPKKPARRAPTKAAVVTAQNDRSPSSISPAPSSTPSPLSAKSDSPFHPTAASTPLPAPKTKLRNLSIPTLSADTKPGTGSNTAIGKIYPTRRSILSVASKPYTHTLCGASFPHPSDVRQHHNGKVGSKSCWVKHGSPAGRDWDEDPNCKVRIGTGDGKVEVEVLRGARGEREGQEGFRGYRVRSWGAWAALLAPKDDGAVADASEEVDARTGVEGDYGAEDQRECDEPVAKKRKMSKEVVGGVGACAEKIAALGLRARK
ncbi:hypothetical protein B0A48_04334 [Cryoendolithus antarcticus]|uniref:Uncharacterized protein n=1 Tax=Cryoendolithus antarcticus TaxID=1507870 RepID=A0A1V8TF24_9PEZI|nr:hypothetical protein B0A48_04334 [Cryoendolithus antarcticus]